MIVNDRIIPWSLVKHSIRDDSNVLNGYDEAIRIGLLEIEKLIESKIIRSTWNMQRDFFKMIHLIFLARLD